MMPLGCCRMRPQHIMQKGAHPGEQGLLKSWICHTAVCMQHPGDTTRGPSAASLYAEAGEVRSSPRTHKSSRGALHGMVVVLCKRQLLVVFMGRWAHMPTWLDHSTLQLLPLVQPAALPLAACNETKRAPSFPTRRPRRTHTLFHRTASAAGAAVEKFICLKASSPDPY